MKIKNSNDCIFRLTENRPNGVERLLGKGFVGSGLAQELVQMDAFTKLEKADDLVNERRDERERKITHSECFDVKTKEVKEVRFDDKEIGEKERQTLKRIHEKNGAVYTISLFLNHVRNLAKSDAEISFSDARAMRNLWLQIDGCDPFPASELHIDTVLKAFDGWRAAARDENVFLDREIDAIKSKLQPHRSVSDRLGNRPGKVRKESSSQQSGLSA